jgi:quercetin dioxygenase-like cupin family protein
MAETDSGGRFLLDPYLDWARAQSIPVHQGFGFDLRKVELAPWAMFGDTARGALVHLSGRGDFVNAYVLELPPGAATDPQRHLFEEVVFVLDGRGSTTVEAAGRRHSFEWGPASLFALPLNARYRHYNARGDAPARLAAVSGLPLLLNAFHDQRFVFDNAFEFPARLGDPDHFGGDGQLIEVAPGRHHWETNFVADLGDFALRAWDQRGAGSANMKFVLADGTMHAHMSELAVGTYKKAHRHGPDFHIFPVTGRGYSLLWYEGEPDFKRVDWEPGWVYAPPDQMFHQHFNTAPQTSRYLAIAFGSIRHPFTSDKRAMFAPGSDSSVRSGGRQVEYEDEDPRIRRIFSEELKRRGVEVDPRMVEIWSRSGAGV